MLVLMCLVASLLIGLPIQGTTAAPCEDITESLCQPGFNYTQTAMSNSLRDLLRDDTSLKMLQNLPFARMECSPYLQNLLCAFYATRCDQDGGSPALFPCRELCAEVKSGCVAVLQSFGFGWPENLECERFPSHNAGQECNLEDFRVPPLIDKFNSNRPEDQGSCEPITVKICTGSGVLHSQTRTPIAVSFGSGPEDFNLYQTQKESLDVIAPYTTHLSRGSGCQEFLKPLVCGVYLPACGVHGRDVTLPCRDLCEQAQSSCRLSMITHGLQWPSSLDCNRFPTEVQSPECLSALSVGEVEMSASDESVGVRVPCTFSLSPAVQPQWLAPDGTPVSDTDKRVFVEAADKHLTILTIGEFSDSVDSGEYTCTAGNFSRSVTLDDIFEPPSACEEIRVPACMTGIAYTSTYVPNFTGQNQEEVMTLMESFSPIFDDCSAYLRSYICSLYLPPCGEKAIVPCQELCLKAVNDCSGRSVGPILDGLRQSCSALPEETNGIMECYNVNEVSVDEVSSQTILGITIKSVSCTYNFLPVFQPKWFNPDGVEITDDVNSLIKVVHVSHSVTELSIHDFTDSVDDGTYVCTGSHEDSAVPVVIGDVTDMYNTTEPDEGPYVPDRSSCEEIRVPACMTGIGYSSTYVPSITGLNQDDVESLMESFSLILDNFCSAYFRPFMCALYLPPCGERAIVPCQELCLKAVNDCATTLAGSFSPAEVTALRESCSSMPSEADDFMECYNVNEVSVDEVSSQTILGVTIKSVSCTYNFLPVFQPKWFDPDGVEITDDVDSRIKVNHVSDSITQLFIGQFTDSVDSGTYLCTGSREDSAVPVVIGDVTDMYNTTEPDEGPGIPGQSWNCSALEFSCNNHECISRALVCDNDYDCADESDETEELCKTSSSGCSVDEHPCLSGECLRALYWCDSKFDCADNSDEKNCSQLLVLTPADAIQVSSTRIDVSLECSSLYVYHIVQEQPAWITPDGDTIEAGSSLRGARVEYVNDFTSRIIIEGYTDEANGGNYVCGISSFAKSRILDGLNPKQIRENCEEIRVPACMTGIGYSSTYVPSFTGLNQDDVESVMESFSLILDNSCSAYFRPYMCSLYLPPCGERAIVPCQELCLKAVNDCATSLAGSFSPAEVTALRESCSSMPSEADESSECYNVNEVSVDEVGSYTVLGRTDKYVDCTYNLLPVFQPKWFNPDGVEITNDLTGRIRTYHFSDNLTSLSISDFTDSDAGTYVCTGSHEDSAVPVVIGDVTNMHNTTEPDEGPDIPDQTSCEEIRVPACMTGIGYSSTYVPSFTGLNQDEVESLMESLSLILDNSCSAYFRPYMCALYLPPCGERAIVPCQELCLKAVNDCATSLAGSLSPAEVTALRESCSSMPSEADESSECYNVNEVSVGEVGSDTNYGFTNKYVYCTYNLLPAFQPKWFNPDGVEITDDVNSSIRVLHSSDSVTALLINQLADSVYAGTYVCTGANEDSAVPVVIGDVTNTHNTSRYAVWPDISEQASCEEIRIPECTKGIGYSSGQVLSFINQDDFLSTFAIFSSFFDSDCSPYFRPYICAVSFPPCQQQRVLPCREMCLRAASECEETLGEGPGVVIAALRQSCKDLPSETDPTHTCYYVKEVEIGEILGEDGEQFVDCTYNLLPEFQPKWSGPDGLEIPSPPAQVSSVKITSSVSRLRIRDFDGDRDRGTYTCHGRDQTASIDL